MILLVEDDPADARLIQRALSKVGMPSEVARLKNGEDAISYLRGDYPFENRRSFPLPRVILLDIKLPRKNGFEVLEWLRKQIPSVGRIPVVMLTSSSHSVDVNRAYDLGANSYIVKPDSTDELTNLAKLISDYWLTANEGPAFGAGREA